MKTFITGTTRGLGAALLEKFRLERCISEVEGLNRPEYDLSRNLDDFVKTDFGLYIINSQYAFTQTELLYKLFEANKNRNCHIVAIGSVSADGDRKQVNQYAIQKKALDAACTQLQLVESKCMITQIKLGRMDTDFVVHIDSQKMNVCAVATKIYDVACMCFPECYVKTITLDTK